MIGHANDQQARSLILCVEDEPDLRRDIADELSEAGYAVIEACDGREALDLLDASRPDLILCDISMPGLSGYDVLRSVRAKGPDYAETPFVFLSALSDPREIVEGKRLGADDYLVKPIDYDLLLATVDARLRQIARIRSVQKVRSPDLDLATLSKRFTLTNAEARVAIALTEGKTLAEIAKAFGVSRTTVAYHLRNIFQKTGVNRQTELVAVLMHGYPPREM
ncbi:response regulator transcription factor [Aminobacter sp. J44]|uniref:response regulator transcription factor n=1 Tax=Aminobacter sp. J44 TaxID=935262 RepID=UPI0011994209|nr:response regulator transcription factor [Aminobacter sp. J44]TWG49783.1 LuxR family two component transcriptional regulator [Aminobacter sp. J44]